MNACDTDTEATLARIGHAKSRVVDVACVILLALLTVAALVANAHEAEAQTTRCYSDAYGNTTCRTRGPPTTRIYTDDHGNTTIRTPGQPTTRGYTDDYGNSTFRTPGQPTVRCYSDAYGNTTCR